MPATLDKEYLRIPSKGRSAAGRCQTGYCPGYENALAFHLMH